MSTDYCKSTNVLFVCKDNATNEKLSLSIDNELLVKFFETADNSVLAKQMLTTTLNATVDIEKMKVTTLNVLPLIVPTPEVTKK